MLACLSVCPVASRGPYTSQALSTHWLIKWMSKENIMHLSSQQSRGCESLVSLSLSQIVSDLVARKWYWHTGQVSDPSILFLFSAFHFVREYSRLTMLWSFQVNREGTQPYIYMHPFSPKLRVQPATYHWAEFPVLHSRSLLVIHFKYSIVCMSAPNSLNIPSPWQP